MERIFLYSLALLVVTVFGANAKTCESPSAANISLVDDDFEVLQNIVNADPTDIAERFGGDGTLYIAVNELRRFISPYIQVNISKFPVVSEPCTFNLVLRTDLSFSEQAYRFRQLPNTVEIIGRPVGILYGTYDLLERLGFRWYAPDGLWTIVPDRLKRLGDLPDEVNRPSMSLRGARTDDGADIPDEYLIWMARNRLNLIGYSGANARLAAALGISLEGGGHNLISAILSNDRMVDGKRLSEIHPDWYGVDHAPIEGGSDFYENPCFAASGIAEFFADELGLRLTQGDLRHVDMIDIWPSDQVSLSIPASCAAPWPDAKPVDHLFDFIGKAMERLQTLLERAAPERRIRIAGISYYDLWDVPNAKVLGNLVSRKNVNYTHIFYVNERSYSEPINAVAGSTNGDIFAALKEWSAAFGTYGIPLGICEYYNYSIYNSLPATFANVLEPDMRSYNDLGVDIHTYMHPIGGDPGPNRLQEAIRSHLFWGVSSEDVASDYFGKSFSGYSENVQRAYDLSTSPLSNVAEMWGAVGGLEQMLTQKVNWTAPPLTDEQVRGAIPDYLAGGRHSLPDVRATHFSPLRTDFVGLNGSVTALAEALGILEEGMQKLKADERERLQVDISWYKSALAQYTILQEVAKTVLVSGDEASAAESIDKNLLILEQNDVFNRTLSPLDQGKRFRSTTAALEKSLSEPTWRERVDRWFQRWTTSLLE